MNKQVRAFDLFCGGGGSSWGAQRAGVRIVGGLDLDLTAASTFKDNFPTAKFYQHRAEDVDPWKVAKAVGRVDLLLASPECTNHTCAKGKGERSEDSRMTAFEVLRFADALQPRWIVIENVIHMQSWARYPEFLAKLRRRGYKVREYKLNAADFSVPQSRRRLFIVCDKVERPPEQLKPIKTKHPRAESFVSLNGVFPFNPLKTPKRAEGTLQRAARAVSALGKGQPYLLVYYGSDAAGGWQRLSAPLRTVTTIDRFAVVKWDGDQELMRMLQVPELRTAMGFGRDFKLVRGTRRDKIRLLGNAVCPPVMAEIVRQTCGITGLAGPAKRRGD